MSKKQSKHPMKPSAYASLVTIVFLLHRRQQSKSIASVIRSTDQLCDMLGFENTVSRMTKYRIVSELLHQNILAAASTAKNKKISLSQVIGDLIEDHGE